MAMLHLLQHALQFAVQVFVKPEPEYLSDFIRHHAQESDVAGTFEKFMDGEIPPEDQIPAVFDLLNRIAAFQIDRLAVVPGNFGPTSQVQ
jgi:hypothetical protein